MIDFAIRGDKDIIRWLKKLPYGVIKVALPALAEYLIGNGRHGLAHYPPYKHVSRIKAYPDESFTAKDGHKVVGYKSLKMLRYVMASIREGRILPGFPRRTGHTQRNYVMKIQDHGFTVKIQNKTAGAYYTRHDFGQARLNMLAGWRNVTEVIRSNIKGAFRHAQAKVNQYLKKGKI